MKRSGHILAVTALILSILWSISAYPVAAGVGPGTVCVVRVEATGEMLTVFVNDRRFFDIAVAVDRDNVSNMPIRCEDLTNLALAVANQEPFNIRFSIGVFTNKGEPLCTRPRDPDKSFFLGVNGATTIFRSAIQTCVFRWYVPPG